MLVHLLIFFHNRGIWARLRAHQLIPWCTFYLYQHRYWVALSTKAWIDGTKSPSAFAGFELDTSCVRVGYNPTLVVDWTSDPYKDLGKSPLMS